MRQILMKKINLEKCSFNKSLNLNGGGIGPLVLRVLLQLVVFMTKQKCLEIIFARQCTLIFPTWAKYLTKFKPKTRDFKRVLDLNCK